MSHRFEVLSPGYLWAISHNSTVNSVWDIVKNIQKWPFSKFQGHIIFKVSSQATFLAKNHDTTVNNVCDIVKNYQKVGIFLISSKYCDLDPLVKVTKGFIIFNVSLQATFRPSVITLL